MNCLEDLYIYIYIFQRYKLLSTEQKFNEASPRYKTANITLILQRVPKPVSRYKSHNAIHSHAHSQLYTTIAAHKLSTTHVPSHIA